MQLTRSAKAAISFLLVTLILMVFDATQGNANMEWMMALPGWLRSIMPTMMNVGMPTVLLVGAYAAFLAWSASRTGHALIIVISILNIVLNLPITYWRASDGFLAGAWICLVEAAIGVLAIYYAVGASREIAAEHEPGHARVTA